MTDRDYVIDQYFAGTKAITIWRNVTRLWPAFSNIGPHSIYMMIGAAKQKRFGHSGLTVAPITLAGPKWSLADLPYRHKSEAA